MKTTHQLIIFLVAFLSLTLSSITCYADQPIDLPFNRDISNQPGRQKAPSRIPLTASFTADFLYFSFVYSVGDATITITDDFGAEVYTETIDTNTEPDLLIPINNWDAGVYHISIEYASSILTAEFEL